MPLFLPDDEFTHLKLAGDTATVADKADAFIRTLSSTLDTVKAEADAAAITAEQTCSLLEHKYLSLSSEFAALESRCSVLDSDLKKQSSEVARLKSDKHQINLRIIEKDGEIERLSMEVKELQKSKRQVVELVGTKDAEISEKNAIIQSYVDKISSLTDRSAQREARLSELEAELVRCRATCDKLSQEKELIEKHNTWLNDELTTKVESLLQQRRKSSGMEAELSMKLTDIEKQYNEASSSLSKKEERVRELTSKLESLQQDLCAARDEASASEQRYSVEISTVSKLADLYKESSEEWSKKAGELEGVIKALETHLSQVESDYKDKLEKECAAREEAEKVSTELKEKLDKCEADLESSRRTNELEILPLSSFTTEAFMHNANTNGNAGDSLAIVPHVPAGVSGTALAASLLREGWSLAKMYAKYQEAADALRHEQLGRKQTQAILDRVLLEIEEKASVILDERAEHERMAEAYAFMNQKLQQSLSEQANLEKVIREFKADLKKREREYNYAQKEIKDLQTQVTILLKECRDVQLRCGLKAHDSMNDDIVVPLSDMDDESDTQKVISEHLLSVKDIKGLVEQNAKIRSLLRSFSDEIENKEQQLKEKYDEELQRHKDEAASRVAAVLERAEEQGRMIESLHSSVAMYRRLYEEEHRLRSSQSQSAEAPPADGRKDFMVLLEGSQEATKRVQEQASERLRCFQDELASTKAEVISLRSERDKLALECNFSQEKLDRFMKEYDHQREELNKLLSRNIEFSQLIVDYQKKLRESAESVNAAEELSRKLSMELSVLKREKELLLNSEKRAQDEVQDLSQRVYRLQATLDTIQSTEQVREETRAEERKKQEEYMKKIEREWAEAKKELQEERNNVRTLSLDRENTIKDARRQVEDMGKELATALQAVAVAESRAAVAEARYADLEKTLKSPEANVSEHNGGLKSPSSTSEVLGDLKNAKEEIERLNAEVQASKDHMHQYKNIAEVNEAALKQIEGAHENFKLEADQLKKSLETEIHILRDRVHELETESSLKVKEAVSQAIEKDEALTSAFAEIKTLKEENLIKVSQLDALEVQVTILKDDLDREHQRTLAAQANYERQVILQSETIQELTKTSQALASLQEEASELRRCVAAYQSENNELKAKWDVEKLEMEKSHSEVKRKYDELNEQNKILHCQLEAIHLKSAGQDSDVTSAGTSIDSQSDNGLQSVVSYLRRSKEIAETEISLLKQEKLRLQSQLERALKAAEVAEASLSTERANARTLLFTVDEFKALKLQVSEMNLLRESNMQLREENKYNFEECQKLREVAQNAKVEAENLQNLLRERELEAEALKKDIELRKKEKEHLEKRISDVFERSKNIDVEDYNRLKSEVEQLQTHLRDKDAVIEETHKLVSQKEEIIAKLEQDLSRTRSELNERENHLSQAEARLKSDAEKQKKILAPYRRKIEALSKEKDALLKEKESLLQEKESLIKERDLLVKEKESLSKEKEVLFKEKDELNKEKQAISKQVEDLRQEKKSTVDAPGDPKEKEKYARMQILENTLGRLREENRKEKEKRQTMEKVITVKVNDISAEKQKFEGEYGKHKEALRRVSDELEKLKHAKDSLPEGTSVIQLLSGAALDDLASAYMLAIESFEKEAHSVFNDVGNQAPVTTSILDAGPSVGGSSHIPLAEGPGTIASMAPVTYPPVKVAEEREKKVPLFKTTAETRKMGRKLVRPRLTSEEPQRDTEMSELDGKNVGKPSSVAQEMTTQLAVPASTEPSVRKRPASPTPSEVPEESHLPSEPNSDLGGPAHKRSKGLEPIQEDFQTQSSLENAEFMPTVDELLEAATDFLQAPIEEASSEFGKDEFDTLQGLEKESRESIHPDDGKPVDKGKESDFVDEGHAVKPFEQDTSMEEASNIQTEQDAAEREDGEIFPEGLDIDGTDETATMGSQEVSEVHHEHSAEVSIPSPAPNDDDFIAAVNVEVIEPNSPDISNLNEQAEEGELIDDVAEDSDKSGEGNDQNVGDADQTSEVGSGATEGNFGSVESAIIREDSPVLPGEEATQLAHARMNSNTININERARERAAARLRKSPAPASTSTPSPAVRRGRGRARAGRSIRGGRRPGDQN